MKGLVKILAGIIAAIATVPAAVAGNLYVETIKAPISHVLPELKHALATHHFKVVMDLDVLKRLEAKEGELHIPNLNQGKFTDVRAFVFCNPMFFSQLLNSEWQSAAVCPLGLTVFGRNGTTTIVYPERTAYTHNAPAAPTAEHIDAAVISALKSIPGAS